MHNLDNLRKVYIDELIKLSHKNDKIVCLDADSKEPLLLSEYYELFPERCFSFGIAEQNMVTAAGGMATMGLIPFVHSYGIFIAMRALDQVRNSIAYPNLNVKFIISHHGLDAGADGITHQLTEDIAIFRAIPNIQLLQPADSIEMKQMVRYAVEIDGPVIIKAGKSKVPRVHKDDYQWHYGKPSIVSNGEKYAIITNGVMVSKALRAKQKVKNNLSINPKVINLSTLTNIDVDELLLQTKGIEFIVTIEDHSIYGGLGSIVCEILSENNPTKIVRIGLKNSFAECGDPESLFDKYEMSEDKIYDSFINNLN